MAENKMEQVESLLKWLVSGEKDEDGNWLSDDDTQLVCDALEYYLTMHGQKNKMAQVAEMFGKKLGEEFRLEVKTEFPSNYVVRFTKDGIQAISIWGDWHKKNSLLVDLLTGKAEIVSK